MNEDDESFAPAEEQEARGGGLLDRIDRAVAQVGHALWRCIVDGFAAYGAAECGLPLDPAFERTRAWEAEIPHVGGYPSSYGAAEDDDLRCDYTDIDSLIRALQSAGE